MGVLSSVTRGDEERLVGAESQGADAVRVAERRNAIGPSLADQNLAGGRIRDMRVGRAELIPRHSGKLVLRLLGLWSFHDVREVDPGLFGKVGIDRAADQAQVDLVTNLAGQIDEWHGPFRSRGEDGPDLSCVLHHQLSPIREKDDLDGQFEALGGKRVFDDEPLWNEDGGGPRGSNGHRQSQRDPREKAGQGCSRNLQPMVSRANRGSAAVHGSRASIQSVGFWLLARRSRSHFSGVDELPRLLDDCTQLRRVQYRGRLARLHPRNREPSTRAVFSGGKGA